MPNIVDDNSHYLFGTGFIIVSGVTIGNKDNQKERLYGITIYDDGVYREPGSVVKDYVDEEIKGATILWFPTEKQRDKIISAMLNTTVKEYRKRVTAVQIQAWGASPSEKE